MGNTKAGVRVEEGRGGEQLCWEKPCPLLGLQAAGL